MIAAEPYTIVRLILRHINGNIALAIFPVARFRINEAIIVTEFFRY